MIKAYKKGGLGIKQNQVATGSVSKLTQNADNLITKVIADGQAAGLSKEEIQENIKRALRGGSDDGNQNNEI